jgi:glycosyltransferase involved in cell wall biosynthesis
VDGFRVVEFDIPCANRMRLSRRSLAFARFAAAATALALRDGWEAIVASSTPLTVALPALAARRLRGTPFLFEIRDPWPELPRALGGVPVPVLRGMDLLADAACRRASAVIGLSEGMAATALRRGADPARVSVLQPGADLDLFGPHVAAWRPDGVPEGAVLAVYAGTLGRANGLDAALDAAAWLGIQGGGTQRAGTPWLLLAGDGADAARLRARAAAEGLRNLLFLDAMPKPRLAGLLAGADIGLHLLAPVPAFAEAVAPNKVADYLAAGLPIVTNTPGAVARLIEGGDCGIAVPPGDGAALGAAIAALAADVPRRRAEGAAARRLAETRMGPEGLGARFVRIVEGIAA